MAKLKKAQYEPELRLLQTELVKMQSWLRETGQRIVIVFEGRDAAGKGGVIKAIREHLNPRVCQVAALPVPSDRERTQWYFQRYIAHLPAAGEIVLFDRSWYNRAGVEKVMGFCTDVEYQEFLQSCPEFENMLVRSGIILLKYWFSVSPEQQQKRFEERLKNPLKRWKFSKMDFESRKRWNDYSAAKDAMLLATDTVKSPWFMVGADDKKLARLNCIKHILDNIPYTEIELDKVKLKDYEPDAHPRPNIESYNHVKNHFGYLLQENAQGGKDKESDPDKKQNAEE